MRRSIAWVSGLIIGLIIGLLPSHNEVEDFYENRQLIRFTEQSEEIDDFGSKHLYLVKHRTFIPQASTFPSV